MTKKKMTNLYVIKNCVDIIQIYFLIFLMFNGYITLSKPCVFSDSFNPNTLHQQINHIQ